MLIPPTFSDIAVTEKLNELQALTYASRAEMRRAHAELDRCLVARRDRHGAEYPLDERVRLLHLDVLTADALATEHQKAHARVKHDLQVSERRRIKLECALSAARRINEILDTAHALGRFVDRLKTQTPVRLIRGGRR